MLGQLLVLGLLACVAEVGERLLERLLLAAKLRNPLGDQLRLDPLLQGMDLGLDLAFELRDLLADPGPGELAVATLLTVVGLQRARGGRRLTDDKKRREDKRTERPRPEKLEEGRTETFSDERASKKGADAGRPKPKEDDSGGMETEPVLKKKD